MPHWRRDGRTRSPAARLKPMALRNQTPILDKRAIGQQRAELLGKPGKAVGRFGLSKEAAPEAGFRHDAPRIPDLPAAWPANTMYRPAKRSPSPVFMAPR